MSLMKYVYILESINFPAETYIGLADDLRQRLAAHNAGHPAGLSPRNGCGNQLKFDALKNMPPFGRLFYWARDSRRNAIA